MPTDEAPKITAMPDGPLLYEREGTGGPGGLTDAAGVDIPTGPDVLLCRCGASTNKPFCTGAHASVGFTGAKASRRRHDRRRDYPGEGVTVHDNRALCAHVEYCWQGLPSVFKREGVPWIDPEGAPVEEVVRQVKECPSGALSHSINGVEDRDQDRAPSVALIEGGPYVVTGGVEIVGEPRNDGASLEHCTLCRCGASANKPFCDGSHWESGFDTKR
jgi:CDGSH-type Zn-finger protein